MHESPSIPPLKNLRRLRLDRGYTQEELGKLLNIQKSAISKYERGTVVPTADILLRLADIFGVSVDVLLGRSQPTPSDAPQATIPPLVVSVPISPTREYLRLAAAFLADTVDRALAAQKTAATPDDVTAVDIAALIQALPPERLQLVAGFADFLSRFGTGRGDLA